jgi:hypothetical protein
MRKNINLKSEKNKNNKIPNISNKKSENKKQDKESNNNNVEINQGVKLTVGNKLLEMEKSHEKVLELEKIIELQNNKIKILNQGSEPYNIQIQNLNMKLTELSKENNLLKQKDLNKDEEISNLKNQLSEENKIKNELIESNKKLQEKIELLNHQLDSFKFDSKKEQEEYNNMCKVKSNFEDKTIQLTEELQKTQTKLQIAENALKQKDKYIQLLINKKNNNIIYNHKKEQEKNDEINESNKNKKYIRPQSSGIKNKNILQKSNKNFHINSNDKNMYIMEQDNLIKKLREKISHLEKDNAGLLIRLKNTNNFKSLKK